MEIILNDYANVALEQCEFCSDWQAKVEPQNESLILPGDDITKVGMMELTFELITNSLKDLKVWHAINKDQNGAADHA